MVEQVLKAHIIIFTNFILFLMNHKQIKEGITIIVVKIKKVPQSPFSQSTRAPDDDASVVLPAVPMKQAKHIE